MKDSPILIVSGGYPESLLHTLSLQQVESMAVTPLERMLVARLQVLQDELYMELGVSNVTDIHRAVEDFKTSEVDKALSEARLSDYKQFFDDVISTMNWPAAEPWDNNLRQAVISDIEHAASLADLVKDLKQGGWPGFESNAAEVIRDHWPLIEDAYTPEPSIEVKK